MTSVIITFKKFPELGRLRVVDNKNESSCDVCALHIPRVLCYSVDEGRLHCASKHYERVKDAD